MLFKDAALQFICASSAAGKVLPFLFKSSLSATLSLFAVPFDLIAGFLCCVPACTATVRGLPSLAVRGVWGVCACAAAASATVRGVCAWHNNTLTQDAALNICVVWVVIN